MEGGDDKPQKSLQPPEQEGEVVAGGGQDGIDGVALPAGEVVAAHPMLGLDVADDGLDGGAAAHLARDGRDDAAFLALMNTCGSAVRMAAIARVGEDAADLITDGFFHVGG